MSERSSDPQRNPPPNPPRTAPWHGPGGLCPACRHVKLLRSDRGSTFLLCQLSKTDASYPRYPPQPRLVCPGFEG